MCMNIRMYIYAHLSIYTYVCIYIYREREREIFMNSILTCNTNHALLVYKHT